MSIVLCGTSKTCLLPNGLSHSEKINGNLLKWTYSLQKDDNVWKPSLCHVKRSTVPKYSLTQSGKTILLLDTSCWLKPFRWYSVLLGFILKILVYLYFQVCFLNCKLPVQRIEKYSYLDQKAIYICKLQQIFK